MKSDPALAQSWDSCKMFKAIWNVLLPLHRLILSIKSLKCSASCKCRTWRSEWDVLIGVMAVTWAVIHHTSRSLFWRPLLLLCGLWRTHIVVFERVVQPHPLQGRAREERAIQESKFKMEFLWICSRKRCLPVGCFFIETGLFLCSLGCPRTLCDPPASAPQVVVKL